MNELRTHRPAITDSTLKQFLANTLPPSERRKVADLIDQSSTLQRRVEALIDATAIADGQRESLDRSQAESTVLNSLMEELSESPPLPTTTKSAVNQKRAKRPVAKSEVCKQRQRDRIGGYRLIRELESGSMGLVFLGEDEASHRQVVIKVLRPELRELSNSQARFRCEAKTIATIQSPHVVQLLDFVDTESEPQCMVTEYVDGPTIRQKLLSEGRFSARDAARLARDIAKALVAAGQAGLVHRDIKPENILIDESTGFAKLIDFGLARFYNSSYHLTADNVVLGTPAYMSPDQVTDASAVDHRADVYSLGIVLYEMLTGQTPFDGPLHVALAQILHRPPRPISQLATNVDANLILVCQKAMAKKVGDRYQSAAELLDDLQRWLDNKPVKASPKQTWEAAWLDKRTDLPPLVGMAGDAAMSTMVSLVTVPREAWMITKYKYVMRLADHHEQRGDRIELQKQLEIGSQILMRLIAEDSRSGGDVRQWCITDFTAIRRRLQKLQPHALPGTLPGLPKQEATVNKLAKPLSASPSANRQPAVARNVSSAPTVSQKSDRKTIPWSRLAQMCQGTLPESAAISDADLERLGHDIGRVPEHWKALHGIVEHICKTKSEVAYRQSLRLFRSIGETASMSAGFVDHFLSWRLKGNPKVNVLLLNLFAGAASQDNQDALNAFWRMKKYVPKAYFLEAIRLLPACTNDRQMTNFLKTLSDSERKALRG